MSNPPRTVDWGMHRTDTLGEEAVVLLQPSSCDWIDAVTRRAAAENMLCV